MSFEAQFFVLNPPRFFRLVKTPPQFSGGPGVRDHATRSAGDDAQVTGFRLQVIQVIS